MKKYLYSIIFIFSVLFASCDMEKMPEGSITDTEAIQSLKDAAKVSNYFNLRLRGLYSGSNIYSMELPTDVFHASFGFGNRGGILYRWEWTAQDDWSESIWEHCYYSTAVANYFLQEVEKMDKTNMSEEELATLETYKGEAYFVRAASMFSLVERFCEVYDASKAATQMGVMLVDSYAPTSDQNTYPGRSSLEETYKFIENNLALAEQGLKSVEGTVASTVLTKDAVTALKARVALTKGDYDTAITAATSLIESNTYPLIDANAEGAAEKFNNLWTNDSGEECIIQFWADYAASSIPSSNSYSYIGKNASGVYMPDFILEKWILSLYTRGDIRQNWLLSTEVTYGTITGEVTLLAKFPGNPQLNSTSATTSNYVNKIKPFRIAEQYLIAAEAYARKGGNDVAARKYYNDLRSKRIAGYVNNDDLTGEALLEAIKEERLRELIGEGFRLLDLKRWKEGFTRSAPQNSEVITTRASDMTVEASYYKFLWPIPQSEIDANPQIATQQNPGYTN